VGALQVIQQGDLRGCFPHCNQSRHLCIPACRNSVSAVGKLEVGLIHESAVLVLQGELAGRREARGQALSDLKTIFPDLLDWKVGGQ
jgi:hypothetical protein